MMHMNQVTVVADDGQLMPADEVRVSPFDLGLSVGLGVFETMQSYDGRVFAMDAHMERLAAGAKRLSLSLPSGAEIQHTIGEVLTANNLLVGRGRVRVAVSDRGGTLTKTSGASRVLVSAVALDPPMPDARVVTSPYEFAVHGGLVGVKSASYAGHVLAFRDAIARGADEALLFDAQGRLCEGAMSNVFLVVDGMVMTPALDCGCLPGVTRSMIAGICDGLALGYKECELDRNLLKAADEVFLTSSIREVQMVRSVDDGADLTSEVTGKIAAVYQERVQRELGL
ncbi:aminotransferase class IV [Verrucomicrobiaceae bacterium N1E253]|uniref:branched-chain-amino-acid transaminase n=1 Tax=Oceaniferula marina TaxID=2748318 RepID=A0A851GAQ8_9BACT|nr:aminotransferase class IV [Oceaniferula marina]NWK54052.1 aminotransferase class IV [Oceaniferula marina]